MTPLLGAVLLASAANAIGLSVTAPKTDVLIGEPVKLELRWSVPRDIDVHLDNEAFGLRFLQVWIDAGGGPQRYCEAARAPNEGLTVRMIPKTNRDFTQNVVLVWGMYATDCRNGGDSPPLPTVGKYGIKLSYDDGRQHAESNVVAFTVKEPSGKDREVFERVGKDPVVLWRGSPDRKLLEKYPDSPYLHLARINALSDREAALEGRTDPDTGESLWRLSQDEYDALCARYHRRVAQELLATAWGAFDEERLELAAVHAQYGDDTTTHDRAKLELEQRFPGSQALRRLEEATPDVDDNERAVKASPQPKQ